MTSQRLTDIRSRYLAPEKGFFTRTMARTWPNGLLIGNGTQGAVVIGHPRKECLIVCHEELFLPLFERLPVLDMAELLPDIRSLIGRGEYDEAMELVVERAVQAGYPVDFIMTDPSHPAFDLLMDFGPYEEVADYRRSVDFSTGEAAVQFVTDGSRMLRRSFASRRDGVIVTEVISDEPFSMDVHLGTRPFDLEAWEPGRTSAGYVPKGQFHQRGIRSVETWAANADIVYRCAYAFAGGGYEGLCRVIADGGEVRTAGTGLRVRGASSVLVLCTVEPLSDFDTSSIPRLEGVFDALPSVYEELLERHVHINADLFGRIELDLDDDGARNIALEDHLEHARSDSPSPGYMELLFDACRYIILSSTGRLPPNLQGLWSAAWTPHWSGDYTLDANVQAAVAHFLTCGTPELMLSLFTLMDRFLPDFRENARRLYGAEGIFVNSRVSTTGLQQRYNLCPVYFWTAGAAWIAHYYWEYYLFTGDMVFLKERAVPFMRETASFYRSFLYEDETGRFVFSPSWSPENHAANTGSPVAVNATMDIAACRELFTNLVSACRILGLDGDRMSEYEGMIAKLPPYLENEDHALKEWSTPLLEDRYSHRHMSHLYPLYPGSEADPDANPELYEMSRRAVAKRLEHYDPSDYGAFGLYHAAIAAARCGDGEHAREALQYLARYHVYSGGATAHNPGPEIFNVDMAGGYPAAVVELLVGAVYGRIRLLPAVPADWRTGSIKGVRCPGRVTITELHWNLDDKSLVLELGCPVDRETVLVLPDGVRKPLALAAGEVRRLDMGWE